MIVRGLFFIFTYYEIEGVLFNYFLHEEFNAINRFYDQIVYLMISSYLFFYCFFYVFNKKIIMSKVKKDLNKENNIIYVDKVYKENYVSLEDKNSSGEENGNNNFITNLNLRKNSNGKDNDNCYNYNDNYNDNEKVNVNNNLNLKKIDDVKENGFHFIEDENDKILNLIKKNKKKNEEKIKEIDMENDRFNNKENNLEIDMEKINGKNNNNYNVNDNDKEKKDEK